MEVGISSEVPQRQIISLAPNNFRAFAFTTLLQHKSTLFAFASEHMVFLYDRQSFKETQITAPDSSSPICALTFCGRGKQCKLLMVNSKGILLAYLLENIQQGPILQLDIGFVPISMTASDEICFYQTKHCLYAIPLCDVEHERVLLTSTHSHDRCEISPCGRALATFTRGGGPPVIWYSPFLQMKRSVLHLTGNLVDFQWGTAEHLTAVSANSLGVVRLWVESCTSGELRCVKWFKFDSPVLSVSFAHLSDVESAVEKSRPSKSQLGDIFPLLMRTPALVLATLDSDDKNLCILQETAKPKMDCPARLKVHLESAIATVCDFRRVFSREGIRRLISVARFTRSSLTFHQFELGQMDVTHITPYAVPFLESPVDKIFKREEVVTRFQNGVLMNWKSQKKLVCDTPYVDFMQFGEQEIVVYPEVVVLQNAQKTELVKYESNEIIEFASLMTIGENRAMVVIGNKTKVRVIYINDLVIRVVDVISVSNTQKGVSIHSSDLFVVYSADAVHAYMFRNDEFVNFASLRCNASVAVFLPHPMALMMLSVDDQLRFYVLTGSKFVPADEILQESPSAVIASKPFPKIRCARIIDGKSMLMASDHMFFSVNLKKSMFPVAFASNSNYVLNTAVSTSNFSVMQEFAKGGKIDLTCFEKTVQSEDFEFPKNPRKDLPEYFKNLCQNPPPNWGVLDTCGLNFMFSMKLVAGNPELLEFIPLFSLWALKSRDQSVICHALEFESVKQLCDSMICLWARDNTVLKQAIQDLLANRVPAPDEVDSFLLLAILIGKMDTAKRIARITQENKLASFYQNFSSDSKMMKRVEKSAYEAQKIHRYSLAAMFFTLRGMKSSAMKVLVGNKELALITGRLLEVENWQELIKERFNNDFFYHWWNKNMDESMTALASYQVPKCRFVSIEMHKYRLKRVFGIAEPWDILDLQLIPDILIAELNPDKEVCHVNTEPEHTVVQSEQTREFSFGMENWDDGIDEYDSSAWEDSDASEEEQPKPATKPFQSNLSDQFRRDPFETGESKVVTCQQNYIVSMIARLLNGSYDKQAIRLLALIADMLYQSNKKVVTAIWYTLIFVTNQSKLMIPLFTRPFEYSALEAWIKQFLSNLPVDYPGKPNAMAHYVGDVTESDRKLANFMSFHEICCVLEENETEDDNDFDILRGFFHHRHRLLYSRLRSYHLSDTDYSKEMISCGYSVIELSDKMSECSVRRKWELSLPNPFISAFYSDDEFQYSTTYEIKMGLESQITGVCINPANNGEIVVGNADGIHQFNLEKHHGMTRSTSSHDRLFMDSYIPASTSFTNLSDLPFDSPLINSLPYTSAVPTRRFEMFQKRQWSPSWRSGKVSCKDISVTCIDSHPKEPIFVTGESTGMLHIWDFPTSHISPSNSGVKYCDTAVSFLSFNHTGDRILMTNENGYVFLSDFKTANLIVSVPGSTAAWLNTDTQIVVCEPRYGMKLLVYDLLCGNSPVQTIPLKKYSDTVPLAVIGSRVATGHDDGSVVTVDLRSSELDSWQLHKAPVRALRFDKSGRFFLSGSSSNSVKVVNAIIKDEPSKLDNIFSDYNSLDERRGILSFAASNHTIIAAGYSDMLRVWHVTQPA